MAPQSSVGEWDSVSCDIYRCCDRSKATNIPSLYDLAFADKAARHDSTGIQICKMNGSAIIKSTHLGEPNGTRLTTPRLPVGFTRYLAEGESSQLPTSSKQNNKTEHVEILLFAAAASLSNV